MGSTILPSVDAIGQNAAAAPSAMQWIPEGTFLMGSNDHYPEERHAHQVHVSGFWIDRSPITNAQFEAFVTATGHVTFAEIAPVAADYPGALPGMLRPGSMVFAKPGGRVDIRDCHNWWSYSFGADWRHPAGAESSLDGLEHHPVVHVTAADAEAYALWAGKALPTEAEWERAARGGLDGAAYAWGDEFLPSNRHMANTWQGEFPWQNLATDGYEGTSPVGAFPSNGYDLLDMIGNVWEWTADWFVPHGPAHPGKACCVPSNPRGGAIDASYEAGAHIKIPRRVLKGGSHLCAPNYCRRYRPAARFAHPIDTSTCHVGFRCILRPATQA
jgi:formylglycine-generating enzyme required for sulfatase activity